MPPEVLVVEDDECLRQVVAETLVMTGFLAGEARSGREALRRLRSGPLPQVILLDLVMADMDGWQFRAEQLLDPALRHIPVIVMSGNARGRDVPSQAFIWKPFGADELLRTVARVAHVSLT